MPGQKSTLVPESSALDTLLAFFQVLDEFATFEFLFFGAMRFPLMKGINFWDGLINFWDGLKGQS